MPARTFRIKRYTVSSDKLQTSARVLVLSDLHHFEHGPDNAELISACRKLKPDLILFAGDMLTGRPSQSFKDVFHLAEELASFAPVYAANGNHETQLRDYPGAYKYLMRRLAASPVTILNNESRIFEISSNRFKVTGLELPRIKYKKLKKPSLSAEELTALIGRREDGDGGESFHLLIAHNPQFAEQYLAWGADLTVCGHFHGGVMRLTEHRVLMSPYGFPLPKYGYGIYEKDGRHLIVTSGLGDHAIPRRINNPMELVSIDLKPCAGADKKESYFA